MPAEKCQLQDIFEKTKTSPENRDVYMTGRYCRSIALALLEPIDGDGDGIERWRRPVEMNSDAGKAGGKARNPSVSQHRSAGVRVLLYWFTEGTPP